MDEKVYETFAASALAGVFGVLGFEVRFVFLAGASVFSPPSISAASLYALAIAGFFCSVAEHISILQKMEILLDQEAVFLPAGRVAAPAT